MFTEFKRLVEIADEISRKLDSQVEISFTDRNLIRNAVIEAEHLIERLERKP